jgi:hypothetical protein
MSKVWGGPDRKRRGHREGQIFGPHLDCTELARCFVPIVMALPSVLSLVGHFESHAIGVFKKRGDIVRCVLWIQSGLSSLNACCAEVLCRLFDLGCRVDAKTEVMEAGSIWLVFGRDAGGS